MNYKVCLEAAKTCTFTLFYDIAILHVETVTPLDAAFIRRGSVYRAMVQRRLQLEFFTRTITMGCYIEQIL